MLFSKVMGLFSLNP